MACAGPGPLLPPDEDKDLGRAILEELVEIRAVAQNPPDLAAAERLSQVVRFNAELRTTCVATLISGGHAENALPQRAKATIQRESPPRSSRIHGAGDLVPEPAFARHLLCPAYPMI
jgi:hypothetical protein